MQYSQLFTSDQFFLQFFFVWSHYTESIEHWIQLRRIFINRLSRSTEMILIEHTKDGIKYENKTFTRHTIEYKIEENREREKKILKILEIHTEKTIRNINDMKKSLFELRARVHCRNKTHSLRFDAALKLFGVSFRFTSWLWRSFFFVLFIFALAVWARWLCVCVCLCLSVCMWSLFVCLFCRFSRRDVNVFVLRFFEQKSRK